MRIIPILVMIFLSIILTSCITKQEQMNQRLSSIISKHHYKKNDYFDKRYISEGHFKCSKSLELNERLASTSDGIYDELLYITNDGKMFFGVQTKLRTELDSKEKRSIDRKNPTAIFYRKKEKFIIKRIIYDKMFKSYGTYRQEMFLKNNKIYIKSKTDNEHCNVYKIFE